MTPTINDVLLVHSARAKEEAFRLQLDAKFYADLRKQMPRLFPEPDEILMHPNNNEYDVLFLYNSRKDEQPEALRLILSLAFQTSEWFGELLKDGGLFSIFSICSVNNYTILLKIVGVPLSDYEFNTVKDTGTRLIGTIKCNKFVPLDINRPDASAGLMALKGQDANLSAYLSRMQSKILKLVGDSIPSKVPIPDNVITAYGLNFDLDLIYNSAGKVRRRIDRRLGYSGWTAVLDKTTLATTLHTIIDVQCNDLIVKVRVTILHPYLLREKMVKIDETSNHILYRAFRETDPDYKQLLESLNG